MRLPFALVVLAVLSVGNVGCVTAATIDVSHRFLRQHPAGVPKNERGVQLLEVVACSVAPGGAKGPRAHVVLDAVRPEHGRAPALYALDVEKGPELVGWDASLPAGDTRPVVVLPSWQPRLRPGVTVRHLQSDGTITRATTFLTPEEAVNATVVAFEHRGHAIRVALDVPGPQGRTLDEAGEVTLCERRFELGKPRGPSASVTRSPSRARQLVVGCALGAAIVIDVVLFPLEVPLILLVG